MTNTLSFQEGTQKGNQFPAKDHRVTSYLFRKDVGVEKQDEGAQRLGQKYSVLEKFKR